MRRVFPLLLALGLFACDDDSEANEARLLLDRLEAIRDENLGAWRRKVDALAAMPLENERNIDVRDKCHAMHDALLRANESTAEAQAAMDRLEAGEEVDPGDVASALARSEAAVAETAELRHSCEDAHAQLRARYGSRRDRQEAEGS